MWTISLKTYITAAKYNFISKKSNNMVEQFITHKMELQISYSICAKQPKKSILWRKKSLDREGAETTM